MTRLMAVMLGLVLSGSAMALEPADLVGTWNVTLTANYSTCTNVAKGDVLAQQWVVSAKSGALAVQVLGGAGTADSYAGKAEANGASLMYKSDSVLATIELTGDATLLTGRRVVANASPCAIIYDVSAKKAQ